MSIVEIEISISEMKKLTTLINREYGFDFSNYALSSFKRRVQRIMGLFKIYDFEELIHRIETDRSFFKTFLIEVTVNTTEMFRAPSMWKMLRDEIIRKLDYKRTIRIWHAGCSSGEEVFSMAILLKEIGIYDKSTIVATDINDDVLENARNAFLSCRNLAINESNYLESGGTEKLENYYSSDISNKLCMKSELFDNVKFYKHNLVKDEAFGKFDIVLCRNVMIYFDKMLQDKVYKLLTSSINELGYLIIGSKESMIWSSSSNRYKTVSEKEKIFQLKS